MFFDLVSEIADVEVIAVGSPICELRRLEMRHGAGRWRKLKGLAEIRLADGTVVKAELHCYEAHGIGRRELKVKHLLDETP